MSEIHEIPIISTNLEILKLSNDFISLIYPDSGYLSPPQVASAYNIPYHDGAGVKIGIIAPLGGGFLQSDLNFMIADMVANGLLPAGTTSPTINTVLLDGKTGLFADDPNNANSENILDIYCIATMVPAADITIYYGTSFVSTIAQATTDGCHIISISYSYSNGEGSLSGSALEFFESLLLTPATNAKIAVCVSSGDTGSTFGSETVVRVAYPASSPQVIAVGGTKLILNTDQTTRLSETDDNRDGSADWGGGGGISGHFTAPSWQSGLYYKPIINNVTGSPTALVNRGVPDISAPMNGYLVRMDSSWYSMKGTSASAPVMAGMLARIQAITGKQRSSAEYNALFYNHKGSFYDIIVGTNNTLITDGYAGTVDWDAVTGLGPPVGNKVFQYMKNGLRPTSGSVFPNHKFNGRPVSGQVWPRTKTL